MAGTLAGKVALVTGGSTGIGRASAFAFAREGAKVIVSDVNASEGEETACSIRDSGGETVFVKADVSSAADADALVKKAVAPR